MAMLIVVWSGSISMERLVSLRSHRYKQHSNAHVNQFVYSWMLIIAAMNICGVGLLFAKQFIESTWEEATMWLYLLGLTYHAIRLGYSQYATQCAMWMYYSLDLLVLFIDSIALLVWRRSNEDAKATGPVFVLLLNAITIFIRMYYFRLQTYRSSTYLIGYHAPDSDEAAYDDAKRWEGEGVMLRGAEDERDVWV